jgi:hypothetical protein
LWAILKLILLSYYRYSFWQRLEPRRTIMAADSAVMDAQNQGPTILAICWLLVIIPGLMVGFDSGANSG